MTENQQDVGVPVAAWEAPLAGRMRRDGPTEVWWWSDETYRIHGFEPGDVVPTTALLLAHVHPEDRERVEARLEHATRTGDAFSSVHRILDVEASERTVTVVGQAAGERDGGVSGWIVDITREVGVLASREATRAIRASAAHRGVIEQAKGIVAVSHGIGVDQAFDLLRDVSNRANVPVRTLARQVVTLADSPSRTSAEIVAFLLGTGSAS